MSYSAHALMENRNGLLVDFRVDEANGYAERRNALDMLADNVVNDRRITVAGSAGYDTTDFVAECRAINVTPHIAQTRDTRRRPAIDDRTTRHAGYLVSQRKRKLIEESFGWMKTIGGFRRTRFKGLRRTRLAAMIVAATYNLLRVCRLRAVARVACPARWRPTPAARGDANLKRGGRPRRPQFLSSLLASGAQRTLTPSRDEDRASDRASARSAMPTERLTALLDRFAADRPFRVAGGHAVAWIC